LPIDPGCRFWRAPLNASPDGRQLRNAPIRHAFSFFLFGAAPFARCHWGFFIMLVIFLCLLWLAACLGVLSVWVLRVAPEAAGDAGDAVEN
jgi:hypothetical protein